MEPTPTPAPRGQEDLWTAVYQQLRSLARQALAAERPDHTLQPTAIVHEAWLRLRRSAGVAALDPAAFLRVAAAAMRRVLIDHARRRLRGKRKGVRVELHEGLATSEPDYASWLAVDDLLQQLQAQSERRAEVVQLRFFGGMTEEQAALALVVSVRTVQSELRSARAWLQRALDGAKT